ncbi:MAG: alanine dehydrogenase [Bacteroidota bacterium]|nr:alanine dehydrogenase [Bacteroidota bacterium]
MEESKSRYAEFLFPQEETLETGKQKSKLSIGIPRELHETENRIPLTPVGVALLVRHGHNVMIETGSGQAAHFPDREFSEAGARILYSTEEIFKSDIILKVSPFTPTEIEFMKPKQTLVSALQLGIQKEEYFRWLMSKKVTAFAFELIRDKSGSFPIIRSMSEIVGNTSVFIAAEYLSDKEFGRGKMFGGFTGIKPCEVVILGAGTVGEYAARSAIGLGAVVKVFDKSVFRLRRMQSDLGIRLFTSILYPEVLKEALRTADVVIGAIHAKDGKTPCIVTEDMIRNMKEGSIIIDVSIDQGGCFETSRPTTHKNPVFKVHGVTHYCVPNIASRVPHTASQALNNILVPLLLNTGIEGGIESVLKSDPTVRHGVYLYNGILTSPFISKYFNLPFQDIELLMASYH